MIHQFEWTKNHAAKSLLKDYMEDRKFGDGSSNSSMNSIGIKKMSSRPMNTDKMFMGSRNDSAFTAKLRSNISK